MIELIELRWLKSTKIHNNTPYPAKELQYRYKYQGEHDFEWSPWQTVPLIEVKELIPEKSAGR